MKKFIEFFKKRHIIIISLLSLLIGLGSLSLLIKNEVSSYSHIKKIQKLNKDRLTDALNYYNEFSKIIQNLKLNTKFSDIEDGEILHNLLNSCYYI